MVRLKFLLVSKTRSSDRNRSNITQEYGEPAMACAPRSEINRIGRNSGNQPALEDPGGGGFLRCRTGCTASKRLRVEDHVLPDRNKTCPRILHSPRSLRQVDCSPGLRLSSPPGRSRPQKTLRHVTNELKVALAGHAAIWARHSPQNPRQRLGPPADIRRSTRIIVSYPSWEEHYCVRCTTGSAPDLTVRPLCPFPSLVKHVPPIEGIRFRGGRPFPSTASSRRPADL